MNDSTTRPGAIELGVFRITVFAVLLASPDVWSAASFASLPPHMRSAIGFFFSPFAIDARIASVAQIVFAIAAVLALIGLWTRPAALIATVAALYLLGIPQLYGTVRHYHHLVWFAALCAAGPSGDAFSVDALVRARRGDSSIRARSLAYALPLYCAWLLIGCVFFFPGLWKWHNVGLRWAFSDNLVNQMRWKWLQFAWLPWLRIDRWPRLCHVAALAVMIFEVAFIFALPFPRIRRVAVIGALLFHLSTAMFMHIVFASLAWCYVAFVPWSRWLEAPYARLLARVARSPAQAPPARSTWPVALVGAVLVTGAIWEGAAGRVHGWPFACYPTFAAIVPDQMPDLEVEIVDAHGSTRVLATPALANIDSQRRLGLAWEAAFAPTRERLMSYVRIVGASDLERASEVRCYRVYRAVDPDAWGTPPRRRELLDTFRPRD